ncbi:MAG TPA: prephenate dehydratase [Williamwhitmania sp.]|jgi:prephenate dehydratase|nr:prephenate dehydratase [Williamwhitmania sp.]
MNPSKVAIQGILGSFHEMAAQQYFMHPIEIDECMTFRQLVQHVSDGIASFGLMAVENSVVGSILPNYALLRETKLFVTGEIYLRIVQNLMALPGETVDSIGEIHSHPMALAQCSQFTNRLASVKLVEVDDTALAAQQIAQKGQHGTAAIGSKLAAIQYGLNIIAASIESNKENYTRFLIVEKKPQQLEGANKASLCFSVDHQVGSLATTLKILAENGIDLTMLQSLPMVGRSWEYYFHADITFTNYNRYRSTLEQVRQRVNSLQLIGEYPQGKVVL